MDKKPLAHEMPDEVIKESIVGLIEKLNGIHSSTDHEDDLLKEIEQNATVLGLPVQRIPMGEWVDVEPLFIGSPQAQVIFVVHGDRVNENRVLRREPDDADLLQGKLDNTACMAVCLSLICLGTFNGLDHAILVTTGEETGGRGHLHGGRGMVAYLQHLCENQPKSLEQKRFICLDVRPLDKKDEDNVVRHPDGRLMELGDGNVLRTKEKRIGLSADEELLHLIREAAASIGQNLVEFCGGGITELGRGWEKILEPRGVSQSSYHVAWLQPPIRNYHTTCERMSLRDLVGLWRILWKLMNDAS